MCPVFDIGLGELTTNATPATGVSHCMWRTAAEQYPPALTSGWLVGKSDAAANASGIAVRMTSFATIGSGGTGFTPASRYPGLTAATTVVIPSYTGGTSTATLRSLLGVGKGGPGAWGPAFGEPPVMLTPNGGAGGNLEFVSFCNEASLKFEMFLTLSEGLY